MMADGEASEFSVAEQLMFTTLRIETRTGDGTPGVATGFIYGTKAGGEAEALFLVTNKHVVEDVRTGSLTFTVSKNGQPALGTQYSLRIEDFSSAFTGHSDKSVDVAAMPFVPIVEHLGRNGIEIFYRSIPSHLIPETQQLEELDALEDVVFIGYPNGVWDSENNLPVIRRGITATPVAIEFQHERKFLVDASVFPGSSGSPVFLYNAGSYAKKTGGTVIGSRLLFLGLIASVFYQEDTGEIRLADAPTGQVPVAVIRQMINLGVVFRADTVEEVAQRILEERSTT